MNHGNEKKRKILCSIQNFVFLINFCGFESKGNSE